MSGPLGQKSLCLCDNAEFPRDPSGSRKIPRVPGTGEIPQNPTGSPGILAFPAIKWFLAC